MTNRDARPEAEIVPIYLRVAPADIAYLKFLFEAHEEIGIVRTMDRQAAVIVVLVMRDFLEPARAILDEIIARVGCEEIPRPQRDGDDWLMREID